MNCKKCKSLMPDDSRYCGICGNRFSGSHQPGIVKESLGRGFAVFRNKPFYMTLMVLVILLVPYAVNMLVPYATNQLADLFGKGIQLNRLGIEPLTFQMGLNLIWILIGTLLWAGFLYSVLQVVRRNEARISNIFKGFYRLFSLLVLYILTVFLAAFIWIGGVQVTSSMMGQNLMSSMLSDPVGMQILGFGYLAIVLLSTFLMSIFVLVVMDRDKGVFASFFVAGKLLKGNIISFLLLNFLLVIINLFGLLALLVGVLMSLSISVASLTAFYDMILKKNGHLLK